MLLRTHLKKLALCALLLFSGQLVVAAVPQLAFEPAAGTSSPMAMEHRGHCDEPAERSADASPGTDTAECGSGCLCCLGSCSPYSLHHHFAAGTLSAVGQRFAEPTIAVLAAALITPFRPPIVH